MLPTYNPLDWYWRAEDGRLFGSRAGAIVAADDAGFLAWSERGGIPTVWPRDEADAQTQTALTAVLVAAGVSVGVPSGVSSAQAKIALMRAGYLPAVKHVIDALGDDEAEIWFADARVWERANPRVLAVAEALGLTPSQVDTLFLSAALIDA